MLSISLRCNYDWQLTFLECIVIFWSPIGQLCLGGPGCSSHTVIHGMLQCSDDISVVRVFFVAEPAMVEPTVTTSLDWTQTQLGWWCLMHNTGQLLRLHSLCIPKGGQMIFWWGSWNFLKTKGGIVKISEGMKGECQCIKMPLKD